MKKPIVLELIKDFKDSQIKKDLLDFFNYDTINTAKKSLQQNNANDVYKLLQKQYNDTITKINNKNIEKFKTANEKKQVRQFKKGFSTLEPEIIAKPTKEQRKQAYENKYKNVLTKTEKTVSDLKQYHKKELKALKGAFQEINYDINNNKNITMNQLKDIILRDLMGNFVNKPNDKHLHANVIIKFQQRKEDEEPNQRFYSGGFAENLKSINYIKNFVDYFVEGFEVYLDDGEKGSSGWIFEKVLSIIIQFSYSNIAKTGSYIPTPKEIENKKCCVNIKNTDDDKCLLYCIAAHFHYEDVKDKNKRNDPKAYIKYFDEIKQPNDITYPINIDKDITKFEKLNNFKINVFTYENGKVNVRYNSRNRNEIIIDLLLVQDETNKQHFLLIREFSRLMRVKGDTNDKIYFCRNCLNARFNSEDKLKQHNEICLKYEPVRAVLPTEEENKMKFKNLQNTYRHPFYITADFEATLIPLKENEESNTIKYQQHKPNSFGLYFNCIYPEYNKKIIICNSDDEEDLMKSFVESCETLTEYAYSLTQLNKKFDFNGDGWNSEQKLNHNKLNCCEFCNTSFDSDKHKKVCHHDHITGNYLATICNQCNLKLQYKRFIPIYIHNLKNYDSHFIVPYLNKYGKQTETENVGCIPNNEEKYISFHKKISVDEYKSNKSSWTKHIQNCCKEDNKDFKTSIKNISYLAKCKETYNPSDNKIDVKHLYFEMRFIDTFAFMATSLEALVSNLKKGCNNTTELRNVFKSLSSHYPDDKQFLLLCEKGIYPYEYITDFNVLYEDKLPPINRFYSKLTNEHCSVKDYEKAKTVWKTFNCKTLLDYHNLYLTSDVLLLSDVWNNFINVCYKIYGLDPSYYFTAPSLSWDAMLKFCGETVKDFEIELLTDMDMYLQFETSIRGGLSQISKRYAKANNKYLPNYNPDELSSFILYLDANNLYGAGMSSYLPYRNFKWNNEDWTANKILALDDKGTKGFHFKVDLEYPVDLHDLHNGYALCSENMIIKNDMLNEFQKQERKESKISKLITNFYDKLEYGLNYRYLKLALQLGLKLKKVHKVIEYDQLNFMEGYIMKNTNERAKAKNSFEKDFYKLMNNSVYGKTMENVRNRINFKLVSTEEKALNIKNTKNKFTIFNENLVGVHLLKKEVKLNKPIFIGQNVLDESKCVMYDFHYNFMLNKFKRENIDLLFTDTDSLCYHIKRQDPYELIKNNKNYFDLSEYPKEHPLYDASNKKVIGKFKDEAIEDGHINYITEFVGLRSKLYAYKTLNNKESKKCKGVKKSVVKKELTFEKYNNIRLNDNLEYIKNNGMVQQSVFRSYKHKLYTESISKLALNPLDDKVYICNNKTDTLTFGHYRIPMP